MVVVVAAAVEAVVAVQIASRQSAHFGVNGERRTLTVGRGSSYIPTSSQS